ncbi:unnamed protein product [Closterium sp. NIES-65]|nr:unnamed protein product [Closterium sp. NIES-65]CAI6002926.1 unnamed protein product [Closterium sp. NIES-65]CAI6002930.1 unnamed protein product [Closterium sp. NIES-65]CAI6002934.1 unnamed protein product [Closterium sp. NIES-65]
MCNCRIAFPTPPHSQPRSLLGEYRVAATPVANPLGSDGTTPLFSLPRCRTSSSYLLPSLLSQLILSPPFPQPQLSLTAPPPSPHFTVLYPISPQLCLHFPPSPFRHPRLQPRDRHGTASCAFDEMREMRPFMRQRLSSSLRTFPLRPPVVASAGVVIESALVPWQNAGVRGAEAPPPSPLSSSHPPVILLPACPLPWRQPHEPQGEQPLADRVSPPLILLLFPPVLLSSPSSSLPRPPLPPLAPPTPLSGDFQHSLSPVFLPPHFPLPTASYPFLRLPLFPPYSLPISQQLSSSSSYLLPSLTTFLLITLTPSLPSFYLLPSLSPLSPENSPFLPPFPPSNPSFPSLLSLISSPAPPFPSARGCCSLRLRSPTALLPPAPAGARDRQLRV